jgi:microcystin degradation protein MlrC
MRIAVGAILHESNTFVTRTTRRAEFDVRVGEEIATAWRGTHHELGGILEALEAAGAEPYGTIAAGATPGGPVSADAFAALTGELLERLAVAPRLDGVLLALHGAQVAEGHPDADGEVLRRVRALIGPDLPLVVTHDFHANISERTTTLVNGLAVYRTNPHVDQRACGRRAAEFLLRLTAGGGRTSVARAQPSMLWNILHQNTSREPLREILTEAARRSQAPGIQNADIAIGYPYADVPHAGPAVVVTAEKPGRARAVAEGLAARLWEARDRLTIELPDPREAVRRARADARTPVVLVDMGDNIGGGSPGDGTWLLSELVEQGADEWIVTLYDPEGVLACERAGIGGAVRLAVGGKQDDRHGAPVEIAGHVRSLHDGRFVEREARHGGARDWNQGRTAVVATRGGMLVLNSRRTPPFSLEQLRSLDLMPESARILVVKAAIAFRAAYEPIAGTILEVDTPGVTAVAPSHFTYRHVRRPVWPLDPPEPYGPR